MSGSLIAPFHLIGLAETEQIGAWAFIYNPLCSYAMQTGSVSER